MQLKGREVNCVHPPLMLLPINLIYVSNEGCQEELSKLAILHPNNGYQSR